MNVSIIVACDENGGIGYENSIPWNIKEDLQHFQKVTINNVIIMGRKTWESIGCKPLKNRVNIVITSQQALLSQTSVYFPSVSKALEALSISEHKNKEIFIIGGEQLYKEAVLQCICKQAYVTHVKHKKQHDYNCDTFFPLELLHKYYTLESSTKWCSTKDGIWEYMFSIYTLIEYNDLLDP